MAVTERARSHTDDGPPVVIRQNLGRLHISSPLLEASTNASGSIAGVLSYLLLKGRIVLCIMFRNMNVDTNAYNSTSSKLRTALSSKNMGLSSSARPIGGGGGGNAWANVSMMKCEEGPDGRIVTMLQSRLEEILVFEISNDG